MAIANTIRIQCNGSNVGDEVWSNVFHARGATNPVGLDQLTANLIGAAVRTAYVDLIDVWHDECRLQQVIVTDLSVDPPASFEAIIVETPPGVDPTPLPPQLAVCISWRTALFSRRGRGRTFIPGLGAGNLDGSGRLAAGSVGEVASFGSLLVSGLDGEGFTLSVLSETDAVSRPIVSGYVDDVFDTLRRRRDKFDGTRTPIVV